LECNILKISNIKNLESEEISKIANKILIYLISILFVTLSTFLGILIDAILGIPILFCLLFFLISTFQVIFGLSVVTRTITKVVNAHSLKSNNSKSVKSILSSEKTDELNTIVSSVKEKVGYTEDLELMVISSPSINALSAGIRSHDHVICITTGALEKLTREEIKSVIYHEMYHIIKGDTNYMTSVSGTFGSPMLTFTLASRRIKKLNEKIRRDEKHSIMEYVRADFLIAILITIISFLFFPISFLSNLFVGVRKEFDADKYAALNTSKETLIEVLRKVKNNCQKLENDYFFMQHLFFSQPNCKEPSKRVSRIIGTYPSIDERIKALEELKIDENSDKK